MAYRHAIPLGDISLLQLSIGFSVVSNDLPEQDTEVVALLFCFLLISTLHLL